MRSWEVDDVQLVERFGSGDAVPGPPEATRDYEREGHRRDLHPIVVLDLIVRDERVQPLQRVDGLLAGGVVARLSGDEYTPFISL